MKKNLLIIVAAIFLVSFITGFNILSSSGKAGNTGSPGEQTCIQCHNSFDLNSGDGSITLANSDLEASNWQFLGGQTYDMELSISHTDASLFGFGLEALNADGDDAGTLIASDDTETQLQSAGGRTNIIHTNNGGEADGNKTFSFQWTAPSDIDEVVFYFAGNAADDNGMNSGDYIYSGSQTLTRSATGINRTDLNQIKTFPNPATDNITLSIPQSVSQYMVYVYNSTGQLVDIKSESSFSVNAYNNGKYYVLISSNNNKPLLKSSFVKL